MCRDLRREPERSFEPAPAARAPAVVVLLGAVRPAAVPANTWLPDDVLPDDSHHIDRTVSTRRQTERT